MIAKDLQLIRCFSYVKGKSFVITARAGQNEAAPGGARPSPASHIP
jgi:hypothetical protein